MPITIKTAALNDLWGLATLEVIGARRAYIDLTLSGDAADLAVSAAWVRLWRAEEHQRQISAQFELSWGYSGQELERSFEPLDKGMFRPPRA